MSPSKIVLFSILLNILLSKFNLIDFSNNSINIVKAVGYVNNSPIIAKVYLNKNINIDVNINGTEKLNNLKDTLKEIKDIAKGVESLKIDLGGSFGNIDAESLKQMQEVIKTLSASPENVTKA